MKTGPPPELEGIGNGLGRPGNPDGKGKGDEGSAADGEGPGWFEGWGLGAGVDPDAGAAGWGAGAAGRSGATVAVTVGGDGGMAELAVMLAMVTGTLCGGGEPVGCTPGDGGWEEGPLFDPFKAKATTIPAPRRTGSAMSNHTEDPRRRERGS